MKNILIIFICIICSPLYSYSQDIKKCSNNLNSYEIDKCLKDLKSVLMNKDIILTIYSTDKSLYKNKNIFLSICDDNINSYKYSDRNGNLTIRLKSKYLSQCKALIKLELISEYGLCPDGKYAIANWDSMELNNFTYFSCGNLK